jgi:hypothetical protein
MGAPEEVVALVERFRRDHDVYRSHQYNETQLRREFIDPFFRALGWDVDNTAGYAPAYRDVIHEDAIKVAGIGGGPKAPDYCFRIGGARKFFLEAKRPSVAVRTSDEAAFQLRRYAWSSKLALSVLTDFDGFAVYDCRVKPGKADKASSARISYLSYEHYVDEWDSIAGVFSREAVLKGSFDRYADGTRAKRGTAEVDAAFLLEIESWRDRLARNIALRNPDLTTRQLNYSVQATIDRIVFLRICEDRGIEEYGTLRAIAGTQATYGRLVELFKVADEKYNSGLFHFRREPGQPEEPDDLTLCLRVDDAVVHGIISELYYPDSPYEFSVLPADILGQVYEQFLGKVIRLTPAHRAVIEDKPEVKKAGGVYYTPTYIVDYIIEKTLGEQVQSKSLAKVSRLSVLDPACGSGSFLVAAYEFLLAWHRDYYIAHDRRGSLKKGLIYEAPGGDWRLTPKEKKRILMRHIYGVDIDPQAVEVTKLSLLLKVIEGETQLGIFSERALPDLGNNIKCGNSLIATDIYASAQGSLFGDEERTRINPFDWKSEFTDVFAGGGFDVVVGNPPYIFTRDLISNREREYFSATYGLSRDKHNTYLLFMELLLKIIAARGIGGYIVPNSWLTIESASLLRGAFVPRLEVVGDINYQVFPKVGMEPSVFTVSGSPRSDPVQVWRAGSRQEFAQITPAGVERNRWAGSKRRIVFSEDSAWDRVVDAMREQTVTIGDVFDVRSGLQAYERGRGTPPQTAEDVANHVFDRAEWEDEHSYRYLQGKDVARYHVRWSGMWMQYGPWLSQPRELPIFARPRTLIREITSDLPHCLHAAFEAETFLNNKSVLNVLHPADDHDELLILCGILNSTAASVFYKAAAVKGARTIFPKVVVNNLHEFPYPSRVPTAMRGELVGLVMQMMVGRADLMKTRTAYERSVLQRQLDATDRRVDDLVLGLFGLAGDEREAVRGAAGRQ